MSKLDDILGALFSGDSGAPHQIKDDTDFAKSVYRVMGNGVPLPPPPPDSHLAFEQEERLAIQEESTLEPEPPLPDVPGFEDLTPATLREHHENALRAAGCVASDSRAVPAPAIGICCADCSHFVPMPPERGDPVFGIGTCRVTGGHLSPDRKACWPRVSRRCAEFRGVPND